MTRRLGWLVAFVLMAQACGGSQGTGPSGTAVSVPLRGVTAAQVGSCTGTLTATGPGPTQTHPLPPFELALSLAAGTWTFTAEVVCNGVATSGQATATVVPPTPVQVTIVVPGHGNLVIAGAANGTVVSAPAGIQCGSDCAEVFPIGIDVTISATPNAGFQFVGYQGGGCGANPVCVVRISPTPVTVTAHFAAQGTPPAPPPPADPPAPIPPPPPLGPTTGVVIVTNTALSGRCCSISSIRFTNPVMAPLGRLSQGVSVEVWDVPPHSNTALWCGNQTPFSVSAGVTTNVMLDGGDCD